MAVTLGFAALQLLGDPTIGLGSAFWRLYNLQNTAWPPILFVALPIVALADPHRRQTDFLHWTGVLAFVATALLSLAGRWAIIYFR
jgi:hypothetical protein